MQQLSPLCTGKKRDRRALLPLRCRNCIISDTSVLELEQAIAQLPPEDLSRLAEWFEEFRADQWDRQIEQDVAAGKLDHLIRKADEDIKAGRFTPL